MIKLHPELNSRQRATPPHDEIRPLTSIVLTKLLPSTASPRVRNTLPHHAFNSLALTLCYVVDRFIEMITSLLPGLQDAHFHLVAPCLQRIGLAKPPPCCDHAPVPTLPTEPSPSPRKTPLRPCVIMPYGYERRLAVNRRLAYD